jgi:hypothetical protein
MPDDEDRYVIRHSFDTAGGAPPVPEDAQLSLLLNPLDMPPTHTASPGAHTPGYDEGQSKHSRVRLDTFATQSAAAAAAGPFGAELYERVLAVEGRWSAWNGYAVSALWEVAIPEHEEAFRRSRRLLFEARREHLRTFAFDWLLRQSRAHGQAARYLVLGLYGSEADLRQSRSHPEVQRIAVAYPTASFGAIDVTGVRYFRVVAGSRH